MKGLHKMWQFNPSLLALIMLFAALLRPAPVSAASAYTYTVSQDYPVYAFIYDSCNTGGYTDEIFLTGYQHFLMNITVAPSGAFVIDYTFNTQGISGVGETSGLKYQAVSIVRGQLSGNVGYQSTSDETFNIIAQGSGNNIVVHANIHMTVNANGTVTADVYNYSIACQ
jgi:hypothetical protein